MTIFHSLRDPSEKRPVTGMAAGRLAIVLSALLQLAVMMWGPAAAAQQCYDTEWFSEEGRAASFCRSGYSVRAIRCRGRYCDNKQLECCRYTPGIDRDARFFWSRGFSEEGNDQQRQAINRSGFMAGLQCSGAYCDNLLINFFYSPRLRNSGVCRYTPRFSEEGAARQSCNPSEFVAGLRCSGRYCDNLELYCCRAWGH